ncbi:L,D-transpeptidase catalytic domain protein [Clostridium sporogenes]|uniref:L,D-transpeptidase catalytic domain protein n=1 Tax=Clostridium sporogenes TaxID=1509 RepID=A0A1L3NL74_CLOSG|nr:L,D-transpeptidase family protein [Clostridium sporogenes]APH16811.1 L,D-transpeptidase catalytic domain protein [Clostridium sporogenes]
MSNFKKLFYTLIFILTIEIILIFLSYHNQQKMETNPIDVSNICILIDITANNMDVYRNGEIIKSYSIAAGKPSTPSPIGTWKIVNKGTWGSSFGGRWMGLNVPWGKYGIHGTDAPHSIGWNSSHGCIRMKNKNVAELYKITPLGTTVIIWGGPFRNFGQGLRSIEPGMRGSDVYEVQKLLKEKKYYNGEPDGIYGESMKSVVHKFQKDNNIPLSNTINSSFYKKLGVELIE